MDELKPCPDELRRVTAYLAQLAADFSYQAGVGGMETAGGFVSFLAANPERAEDFIADPICLGGYPVKYHVEGCLSWHGADQEIHNPREIRRMEGRYEQ